MGGQTAVGFQARVRQWVKVGHPLSTHTPVCPLKTNICLPSGSRGVALGRSMTQKELRAMDPENTVAQELCPPAMTSTATNAAAAAGGASEGRAADDVGTKTCFDVRVFSCGTSVLAVTSRHFTGGKM